jgi:thioredoxin reductase
MDSRQSTTLDVAIIGGGPAGVSACLDLSKASECQVALFESEPELGGIPRTCHVYFGLRDQKKIYTGPMYGKKLDSLARGTSTDIHLNTTVLQIVPGNSGELHKIQVGSPEGFRVYDARTILLATGCYESPRDARMISGPRPAGIFTTGTLQELVSRYHLKPGKRALIVGSEIIALSCVLTLRRAGMSIVGLVEEDDELQTYSLLARSMSAVLGFPIYEGTSVHAILGTKRVEGVKLIVNRTQEIKEVKCDSLILTGKFRSYSPLIDHTVIGYDPATFGPFVDMNLMTSVPGIFAAGNVLRGAEMHDLCALEGKRAAQSIVRYLRAQGAKAGAYVSVLAEDPIRYVVPQKIIPEEAKSYRSSLFHPGPSIQLSHTVKKGVLEAWSGSQVIWRKPFSKLIASTRIALPLDEFSWQRADREKGVVLRVAAS